MQVVECTHRNSATQSAQTYFKRLGIITQAVQAIANATGSHTPRSYCSFNDAEITDMDMRASFVAILCNCAAINQTAFRLLKIARSPNAGKMEKITTA